METTSRNNGVLGVDLRRLVRFFRWLVLNSGFTACIWLGVHGNVGAARLACFTAWLFGILAFMGSQMSEVKKLAAEKGRSAPAWLSHGLGLSLMAFLVWHGWWWTAIAMLLMELGETATFHKPNDKTKP